MRPDPAPDIKSNPSRQETFESEETTPGSNETSNEDFIRQTIKYLVDISFTSRQSSRRQAALNRFDTQEKEGRGTGDFKDFEQGSFLRAPAVMTNIGASIVRRTGASQPCIEEELDEGESFMQETESGMPTLVQ